MPEQKPRDRGLAELDRQEALMNLPHLNPKDRVQVTFESNWEDVELATWHNAPLMSIATVEVLERADDPTIGEIRAVAPSADGIPKTAVKVGSRLSENPGARCMWVIVETGEMLADGTVSGLGDVIGAVPDSPAAKAQAPACPSVRVSNEPHGPSPEVRRKVAELVLGGYMVAAVKAVQQATHWRIDDAHQYIREMSEYQTYLAARGEKRETCTRDDCPAGPRCSSGATVWHDRTPECGEVDPTEADRMRAMGFDRQPEFKVSEEDRLRIEGVLVERMGEYLRAEGEGDQLNTADLAGVVADIVFAAIRRDRERGGR